MFRAIFMPQEFFAETEPVVGEFHGGRTHRPQREVGHDGVRKSPQVGTAGLSCNFSFGEGGAAEYLETLHLTDGARFEDDGGRYASVQVHFAVVPRAVVGGEYEKVAFRNVGIEEVGAVGPAFGCRRRDCHDVVAADELDDALVYPVVRMFPVCHVRNRALSCPLF